jgi:nicotinate phosphoribosyltransferase
MDALLVDLYELTMGESYVAQGLADRPATFELFCRSLPNGWRYLLASGIEEALDHLEQLRFTAADLAYLESTGLFGKGLLERLGRFSFGCDVRALREGTVFFPYEPVLEVRGPLLEAQIVETALIAIVHVSTLMASRAARVVQAAQGRRLVEFGLRRAHGGEAGLEVARASFLAGFAATSNVLAGQRYGIPVAGTMAHSYVQAFADEREAFERFTRSYPDGSTLLIDTYDTVEGAQRAAAVAKELSGSGGRLGAVRLDSGDLLELSRRVREVLDEAGLADVEIFATGNLDEASVAELVAAGAPIDAFGIGTRLSTAAGASSFDLVYKLVELDGHGVMKLSSGKATLPGSKQVWRLPGGDVVALADEAPPEGAEPLLEPALAGGSRVRRGTLAEARALAARQLAALPPGPRAVEVSAGVEELRRRVEARLSR